MVGLGLLGGEGNFKAKLGAVLKQASTQRHLFAVLRAFVPNLLLSRQLVRSYENTGTALITRRQDVLDVLNRNDDFAVVYEPRMRKITEGENFFLGMQPGWPYTRDTSAMRLAARRTDVAELILPRAAAKTEEFVAASGGSIDLPQDLTLRVPYDMVATYFGTPGPSEREMIDWMTIMFWYLFSDLGADPEVERKAMAAATGGRAALDQTIAARKTNPTDSEDLINRCLALQTSGTPGMDDMGIRNNIIGLQIGAIPTISKACNHAMEELFNRPAELEGAQKAARAGDDHLLAQYIWEALRFNPHQPLIYRRALRDAVIAPSTLRRRTIPKDTMVMAVSLAATFDNLDIEDANSFRTDRAFDLYMTWGYGMHLCFGAAINRQIIPAILKPLLRQKNLRRAGEVERGETPFPQHFRLEFDPA
ncbi:MAG: cytochrome P450 [Alphaproteobacteria bacterium]|nr:cytochrome P450 [Alphaproteobacteria bacterium]